MKEDYEIKFWKDWLEADTLKRWKLVEKLPFLRQLESNNQLPLKIRKHYLTSFLNGYFEDLEQAVYTKIRLEKEKNKVNIPIKQDKNSRI